MGDGLKLDEGSIKVFIGEKKVNSADYSMTAAGQKLTVEIADVKTSPFNAVAGDVITVKYNAKLTNAAAFENINTAYLEYSNDPKSEAIGKTVSDEVTVFTFTLDFNKVDGNSNPLPGAGFTLICTNLVKM